MLHRHLGSMRESDDEECDPGRAPQQTYRGHERADDPARTPAIGPDHRAHQGKEEREIADRAQDVVPAVGASVGPACQESSSTLSLIHI